MDNTLDERVATAIISLDDDIKIKPSFDAVSYVNQRKSINEKLSLLLFCRPIKRQQRSE